MDQEASVASNCYCFLPQRPFSSPPQVSDGPHPVAKVSTREVPHCRSCCEGTWVVPWSCPGPDPQPDPPWGISRSPPVPALLLLTRHASSVRLPPAPLPPLPSTTRLLRGRVQNGASACQNILPPAAPASPPSRFHPRSPSPESWLSSTFPSSWCYVLPHFCQNPTVNPCSHIPLCHDSPSPGNLLIICN